MKTFHVKSRSTKNWFSLRFAFFEEEKVGNFLDDPVEKANISIFVDKCTTMFVIGVF